MGKDEQKPCFFACRHSRVRMRNELSRGHARYSYEYRGATPCIDHSTECFGCSIDIYGCSCIQAVWTSVTLLAVLQMNSRLDGVSEDSIDTSFHYMYWQSGSRA